MTLLYSCKKCKANINFGDFELFPGAEEQQNKKILLGVCPECGAVHTGRLRGGSIRSASLVDGFAPAFINKGFLRKKKVPLAPKKVVESEPSKSPVEGTEHLPGFAVIDDYVVHYGPDNKPVSFSSLSSLQEEVKLKTVNMDYPEPETRLGWDDVERLITSGEIKIKGLYDDVFIMQQVNRLLNEKEGLLEGFSTELEVYQELITTVEEFFSKTVSREDYLDFMNELSNSSYLTEGDLREVEELDEEGRKSASSIVKKAINKTLDLKLRNPKTKDKYKSVAERFRKKIPEMSYEELSRAYQSVIKDKNKSRELSELIQETNKSLFKNKQQSVKRNLLELLTEQKIPEVEEKIKALENELNESLVDVSDGGVVLSGLLSLRELLLNKSDLELLVAYHANSLFRKRKEHSSLISDLIDSRISDYESELLIINGNLLQMEEAYVKLRDGKWPTEGTDEYDELVSKYELAGMAYFESLLEINRKRVILNQLRKWGFSKNVSVDSDEVIEQVRKLSQDLINDEYFYHFSDDLSDDSKAETFVSAEASKVEHELKSISTSFLERTRESAAELELMERTMSSLLSEEFLVQTLKNIEQVAGEQVSDKTLKKLLGIDLSFKVYKSSKEFGYKIINNKTTNDIYVILEKRPEDSFVLNQIADNLEKLLYEKFMDRSMDLGFFSRYGRTINITVFGADAEKDFLEQRVNGMIRYYISQELIVEEAINSSIGKVKSFDEFMQVHRDVLARVNISSYNDLLKAFKSRNKFVTKIKNELGNLVSWYKKFTSKLGAIKDYGVLVVCEALGLPITIYSAWKAFDIGSNLLPFYSNQASLVSRDVPEGTAEPANPLSNPEELFDDGYLKQEYESDPRSSIDFWEQLLASEVNSLDTSISFDGQTYYATKFNTVFVTDDGEVIADPAPEQLTSGSYKQVFLDDQGNVIRNADNKIIEVSFNESGEPMNAPVEARLDFSDLQEIIDSYNADFVSQVGEVGTVTVNEQEYVDLDASGGYGNGPIKAVLDSIRLHPEYGSGSGANQLTANNIFYNEESPIHFSQQTVDETVLGFDIDGSDSLETDVLNPFYYAGAGSDDDYWTDGQDNGIIDILDRMLGSELSDQISGNEHSVSDSQRASIFISQLANFKSYVNAQVEESTGWSNAFEAISIIGAVIGAGGVIYHTLKRRRKKRLHGPVGRLTSEDIGGLVQMFYDLGFNLKFQYGSEFSAKKAGREVPKQLLENIKSYKE